MPSELPRVAVVIPKAERVRVVVTGDREPAGWSDFTDRKAGLEVLVSPTVEDKVPYSVLKGWSSARVKEPTVVALTDEAAYAKLVVLLSEGHPSDEVRRLFASDLAGELTP